MEGETRGKMLQRHKKELLELKKGKGGRGLGKKELASKEAEMKERHEKELMSLHEVEANGVEEHTVDKELQVRLPLAPGPPCLTVLLTSLTSHCFSYD